MLSKGVDKGKKRMRVHMSSAYLVSRVYLKGLRESALHGLSEHHAFVPSSFA
jgi:hypothetical protein